MTHPAVPIISDPNWGLEVAEDVGHASGEHLARDPAPSQVEPPWHMHTPTSAAQLRTPLQGGASMRNKHLKIYKILIIHIYIYVNEYVYIYIFFLLLVEASSLRQII